MPEFELLSVPANSQSTCGIKGVKRSGVLSHEKGIFISMPFGTPRVGDQAADNTTTNTDPFHALATASGVVLSAKAVSVPHNISASIN